MSSLDSVTPVLIEQNQKWANTVANERPDFFPQSAASQQPKVLWIGCADSRVPESVILESMPGAIFTHRNIANQVFMGDLNGMAVLKYAVEELRVEHIIIAGHSACGGVAACYPQLPEADKARCFGPLEKATLSESPADPLFQWLAPLKRRVEELVNSQSPRPDLQEVIDINVRDQVEKVASLPVIQDAWMRMEDMNREYLGPEGERNRRKLLGVHGWCYELGTGLVRDLGVSIYSPNFKQ